MGETPSRPRVARLGSPWLGQSRPNFLPAPARPEATLRGSDPEGNAPRGCCPSFSGAFPNFGNAKSNGVVGAPSGTRLDPAQGKSPCLRSEGLPRPPRVPRTHCSAGHRVASRGCPLAAGFPPSRAAAPASLAGVSAQLAPGHAPGCGMVSRFMRPSKPRGFSRLGATPEPFSLGSRPR